MGQKPSEAQRLDTSPHYRFRSADGLRPHEWHVTRARVVFFVKNDKSGIDEFPNYDSWHGCYLIDEYDDIIAAKLKNLIMQKDRPVAAKDERHQGLGQVVADLFYLISGVWTSFFMEAETHLQVMVSSPSGPFYSTD